MLKCLNIVFTSMFSMECVLKIIAFGVLVGASLVPFHLFSSLDEMLAFRDAHLKTSKQKTRPVLAKRK